MKDKETVYEYSIPIFINMVLERKKRKFSNYMDDIRNGSGNNTLKKILDDMFAKEFKDPERKNEALEIFRKMVAAKDYLKNGSAVGKSEIAFAMFFGDC